MFSVSTFVADMTSSDDLIDSHIHFWDPARLHYEWLETIPALRRPFPPTAVETGRHESRATSSCRRTVATTRRGRRCPGSASLRATIRSSGVVAYAGLHQGTAARAELERLAAHPLVVGVRRLLQGEPESLLMQRARWRPASACSPSSSSRSTPA